MSNLGLINEISSVSIDTQLIIFANISLSARASCERSDDKIPFWRTFKADGELNPKYPGGIEYQKEKLSDETTLLKQKAVRSSGIEDYEDKLYDLKIK